MTAASMMPFRADDEEEKHGIGQLADDPPIGQRQDVGVEGTRGMGSERQTLDRRDPERPEAIRSQRDREECGEERRIDPDDRPLHIAKS